jgi:hypothetical protein
MFPVFDFPRLESEGYTQSSEATWAYNCVAWAAADNKKWWWPFGAANAKEAFWPSSAPRAATLHAFTAAFKTLGYSIDRKSDLQNPTLEVGLEKIAIFALNASGAPTHAARQLENGKWTHKMGTHIDLETTTLTAVEGPKYGYVVRILRRKRPKG